MIVPRRPPKNELLYGYWGDFRAAIVLDFITWIFSLHSDLVRREEAEAA